MPGEFTNRHFHSSSCGKDLDQQVNALLGLSFFLARKEEHITCYPIFGRGIKSFSLC